MLLASGVIIVPSIVVIIEPLACLRPTLTWFPNGDVPSLPWYMTLLVQHGERCQSLLASVPCKFSVQYLSLSSGQSPYYPFQLSVHNVLGQTSRRCHCEVTSTANAHAASAHASFTSPSLRTKSLLQSSTHSVTSKLFSFHNFTAPQQSSSKVPKLISL